jgi:glycosyltransferase involved in cell wall biosynthesis
MKYLLVNHLSFGRGSAAGRYVVSDMWLEDLRAQTQALRNAGMSLVVATPLVDKINASGSSASVEIDPKEMGFDYVPLPDYKSMKQYLRVRRHLRKVLEGALRNAIIVQCGYGGHPVPLGSVVWPIAQRLGTKRIWIFDGGDPFPQWEFHARTIKNPIKRWGRLIQLRRFQAFCRRAITDANVVFAHNNAVVQRFKDAWNDRCHQFHRTFVTDEMTISDAELAERQKRIRDASQPLRLVAAGRQIAIKGTDQLLRALRGAVDKGANLQLDILGGGEDLPRFQSLAGELGLNGRANFVGSVPYGQPLFDEWSKRHVMVVTNLTSEFSRNLLLAMARGLPLITYSNPGDGLVEPNGAGIIVPMGDIGRLTDALLAADRDRDRLAELAGRALLLARETTLQGCHQRRAQLAAAALK